MGHDKYMLGMQKDPMGTLHRMLQVNHRWHDQDSQCQDGRHEKMQKNEK